MPITSTERAELRRLLKGRFETLEQRIDQRLGELRLAIEAEIIATHKRATAPFQKRLDAITKKLAVLEAEADDLANDVELAGLALDGSTDGRGYYRERPTVLSATVAKAVTPSGIDKAIAGRLAALKLDGNSAKLRLREMRLELEEELITGALTSTSATTFLARVPTIDTVVAIPETLQRYLPRADQ